MTTLEKILLPDGYARLNLREWQLAPIPAGKSLIKASMRRLTVEGIKENKPDNILWFDEGAEVKRGQ